MKYGTSNSTSSRKNTQQHLGNLKSLPKTVFLLFQRRHLTLIGGARTCDQHERIMSISILGYLFVSQSIEKFTIRRQSGE